MTMDPTHGVLLDTHVLLWALMAPQRLSPGLRMVLANGAAVDATFGARPLFEADMLVLLRTVKPDAQIQAAAH